MKIALLTVVVIAACHDDPPRKQDVSGDELCATAGDGTREVWAQEAAKQKSAADRRAAEEAGEKQVARIVRHCKAEHWSAEAIACVRKGTLSCNDVLTPEQRKGLQGADRP